MVHLSRLTDYGVVLLAHIARDPSRTVRTARDLARESSIPLPTVSKVLKRLARGALLASHRGIGGGYSLARPAETISASDIVDALEGPIALTLCSGHPGECLFEPSCAVRPSLQYVNTVIRETLHRIPLSEIVAGPPRLVPLRGGGAPGLAPRTSPVAPAVEDLGGSSGRRWSA